MSKSSKIMLDAKGSNNMMFLPLDKILQQQDSDEENKDSRVDEILNRGSDNNSNSSIREEMMTQKTLIIVLVGITILWSTVFC